MKKIFKNNRIIYIKHLTYTIVLSIISLNIGVLIFPEIKIEFLFPIVLGFIFGNIIYFTSKKNNLNNSDSNQNDNIN